MIHSYHLLLPLCGLLLSMIACGGAPPAATDHPASPATFAPTSLFSNPSTPGAPSAPADATAVPLLTSAAGTQPAAKPELTVSVIMDKTTQQVTREQAQGVITEASIFLREFSPFGLTMVDYTEDATGGSMSDIAVRYLVTRSAFPPNGLVIFSYGDNGQARASGGYGFSLPQPGGFKNAFVSPAVGEGQMYVAVVDYGYRYMACGYGGSEAVQSSSSLPGECRGQTGIACVPGNGYSMCSNAIGNLYTSTPTHEASSMVVHGLLHNFGPGGDKDDYITPECSARMGYPPGFFDLQESEYYNGLCPYVYEEFNKSYQP